MMCDEWSERRQESVCCRFAIYLAYHVLFGKPGLCKKIGGDICRSQSFDDIADESCAEGGSAPFVA